MLIGLLLYIGEALYIFTYIRYYAAMPSKCSVFVGLPWVWSFVSIVKFDFHVISILQIDFFFVCSFFNENYLTCLFCQSCYYIYLYWIMSCFLLMLAHFFFPFSMSWPKAKSLTMLNYMPPPKIPNTKKCKKFSLETCSAMCGVFISSGTRSTVII